MEDFKDRWHSIDSNIYMGARDCINKRNSSKSDKQQAMIESINNQTAREGTH